MKKIFKIAALIVLGTSFVACKSVHRETITNEIMSEKMVLNTFLDRSDYTIIGTATGTSEFVYYDSEKREYAGDSGKYGYIFEPADNFVGQADNGSKMYVGTGKKPVARNEAQALYRARLNANYLMIEDAYKMGGDSVFEPIYSVETIADDAEETPFGFRGGKVQYKVTVRAKVIQIKKQ